MCETLWQHLSHGMHCCSHKRVLRGTEKQKSSMNNTLFVVNALKFSKKYGGNVDCELNE